MIVLQASATVLGQRGVEAIAFADGTVWTHDDIIAQAHVNVAPVVSVALPDFVMPEDTAFSFALPTASFSDADDDSLTYTATLASGAALPAWLLFDVATQSFSGTPPLDWNSAIRVHLM